jgi:hypothetical protein
LNPLRERIVFLNAYHNSNIVGFELMVKSFVEKRESAVAGIEPARVCIGLQTYSLTSMKIAVIIRSC